MDNLEANKNMNIRGPLWNALGSLMYGGNSFLLLMLVSRYSGVEAAGNFGIAFTTAQLLYQIGILGVSNYHMTDYQEKFSFSAYARLKAVSCCIMATAAPAVCAALQFSSPKILLTLVLTVYMLAHSVSELWQNRMFQKNRLDLSGQCLFLRTFASLAAFGVCLLAGGSLEFSCIVLAGTNLISIWLFAWLPCKLRILPSRKAENGEIPGLVRACLPLFLSLLLMNVLLQMPKFAVEAYCTSHLLGIFNMIFMPVQVINLVSSFIFRPMLKNMADQVENRDTSGLIRILCRQFILVGGFILMCLAGAWMIGTPVMGFLYGTDLTPYRLELMGIVLGGGMFAFCQVFYYVTLLFRRQKLIFCNYGICAAVYLAACPMMTRQFDIWGAIGSFIAIHILLLLGYLLILAMQLRRLDRG